ncbi:MAG: zinc ribbon domain-containing protein [Dehalococcoidales bacterium]
MSIARDLYQLQEIDTALEANLQAQKKVSAQIGESQIVLKARAKLDEEMKNLERLAAQQKSTDWEIDDLTAKIKDTEKKLYGGKIFNSKELGNLQQETDDLKKRRSAFEDKSLELMDQLEIIKKAIENSKDELAKMELQWQAQQKQLTAELEQLKAAQTALEDNRKQITVIIDADALAMYQELRKRKGLAVAKVEQGICQGCRITLPNTDLQRAKGGGVVRCSSCGRIIFLA